MTHRAPHAALLALTLACGLPASLTFAQENREPVDGETLLPVREVTLYRSGVGAFERQGLIDGSSTVSLRFETDQINDILKSMVLLDLDGGKVSAVGYGSQEPLDRRLASFAIDLSGNPSTASLLRQLRGAEVRIVSQDQDLFGRVLSTETREVFNDKGERAGTSQFVTLLEDGNIVTIDMRTIRFFALQDEALQAELERALLALADNTNDQTKSVELRFEGQPGRARRVVVAYVTEMPVWKTSYRLVLDASEDDPSLYAWAIVENTTDHDWRDVTLALASGRPVSFTMDLYEPLFAERPEAPVPFLSAVAPRLYESTRNRKRNLSIEPGRAELRGGGGGESIESEMLSLERALIVPDMAVTRDDDDFDLGGQLAQYMPSAAASAGLAGEQFMYTVDGPVTIERQRSAMLPIISSPIDGRRVSIYSPNVNPTNPMRGVELTNDSGLHLMPGPIAVYDAGAYAGDAQIPHTSRNQTRLLSYAVDLPVRCERDPEITRTITDVSIIDGLLITTTMERAGMTYTIENSDTAKGRTLLVEHPKRAGWTLITDVEHEELSNAYRVEVELDAGASTTLEMREQFVTAQRFQLAQFNETQLLRYVRNGTASQRVLDAFREATALRNTVTSIERSIADLREELGEIDRDQRRIRENLKTVREGSELASRYLTKLASQEDRIEEIGRAIETREGELVRAQRALSEYLRDLDVD